MEKSAAYKREIIKELFFNGELSIGDVAAGTQKSLPLVAKILNELVNDGWIVETGYATSTGGRRPQMFSLAEGTFYIVSVAVDQHVTQAAIIDVNRKITGAIETLELDLKANENALDVLSQFISTFITNSGIPVEKIAGIGIGMPGFVDANEGVNYSFFKIPQHTSLNKIIGQKTGLPVFVDNDSSVIALAELKMGHNEHPENTMVINIGWGTGLGMIINGKLFRGNDGFAGEFSHIPLFQNNKICSCGKSGCLETEASLYVMIEKAIKGIEEGHATVLKDIASQRRQDAVAAIMQAAIEGDKLAVEILSDIAFNIGRGVAVLIHIVNPGKIILSGRGAKAGKLLLAPVQQALNVYCIPRIAANTIVEVSSLGSGQDAALLGAAALVIENFGKTLLKEVKGRRPVSSK